MQYSEELHWILDNPKYPIGSLNEKYQKNIDFVHSLGLKCDCVGWSSLDLANPRTPEILDAIEAFCRENGWKARGLYFRKFAEAESEWYAIRFSDNALIHSGFQDAPTEDGDTTKICTLNAYRNLNVGLQEHNEYKMVPERFRNACIRLGIGGVDFCWAKDRGKYAAEQYFHIYPHHAVSHQTGTRSFEYSTKGLRAFDLSQRNRIQDLGGSLPRLAEIFYNLHISLPECYLASELPKGGFSSAFVFVMKNYYVHIDPDTSCAQRTYYDVHGHHILVHKDTAALLLREKALPSSALEPVPVMDAFLPGYEICRAHRQVPPSNAFRENMLREYEALKNNPRPIRLVTEKDALKVLRKAKQERPEDFRKAMPKIKRMLLAETNYGVLAPYYQITSGGFLSDEYELLPYDRAIAENEEFHESLQAEELLKEKPDGIVIGKCPDGDAILLLKDGRVIRFNHEGPEPIDQWLSLPVFIVDAINAGA